MTNKQIKKFEELSKRLALQVAILEERKIDERSITVSPSDSPYETYEATDEPK